MSVVKSVSDFFKMKKTSVDPKDRYGVLGPLLSSSEYIQTSLTLFDIFAKNPKYKMIISGIDTQVTPMQKKAKVAYTTFMSHLPNYDKAMERASPFSVILIGFNYILENLRLLEDNFSQLFDVLVEGDEESIKLSSVIAVGYIEQANQFANWVSYLIAHLSDDTDHVPPFWSMTMLKKAEEVSTFVACNIVQWNPKQGGFINQIKNLQQRGADAVIKTGDSWLDDLIHDNQLHLSEQTMITNAFISPILLYSANSLARHQELIDLWEARKNWLVAKISYEQAKLQDKEVDSPDYAKMTKAIDYYASEVSKIEARLERMRS